MVPSTAAIPLWIRLDLQSAPVIRQSQAYAHLAEVWLAMQLGNTPMSILHAVWILTRNYNVLTSLKFLLLPFSCFQKAAGIPSSLRIPSVVISTPLDTVKSGEYVRKRADCPGINGYLAGGGEGPAASVRCSLPGHDERFTAVDFPNLITFGHRGPAGLSAWAAVIGSH